MNRQFYGFIVLLFSIIVVGFANSVFAQSDKTTDIQSVKARYCNDPNNPQAKSLFIDTEAGKPETICIDFINSSDQEAIIGINFVDGTLTNDSTQNKACLAEGEKNNFGQYVSNYSEIVTIPARGTERVTADLLFDDGYAGTSYGCLTFHAIEEHPIESNSSLTVFARVGSFIDAFVKGDFKLLLKSSSIDSTVYRNITRNPNFIIYRVERRFSKFFTKNFWTYKTKRNVVNEGNVGLETHLTFTIRSWYIFSKHKTITNQPIAPGQTRTFEYKLPWYMTWLTAGPIRITGEISYTGIYLGEYAKHAPDTVYILTDHTSHFFMPRLLLIILSCGVMGYRKREKLQKYCQGIHKKIPKIKIIRGH